MYAKRYYKLYARYMKIYNRYRGNKKRRAYAYRILKVAKKYLRSHNIYKKKCQSSKRRKVKKQLKKTTKKTKRKIKNSARNCILANKYYAQYINIKTRYDMIRTKIENTNIWFQDLEKE